MSAVSTIVAGVATKVGAPIIKGLLEKALGKQAGGIAGDVADRVIGEIATRAGVEPVALPDLAKSDPDRLGTAIEETEAAMPELIALWSKGLDGQFALLKAETAEGFWQSFWRYGWMYLLAFFWLWRIIILPVINRFVPPPAIEAIDLGILLTLTSWFIALYMGGHTVKQLGVNIADAVKGWRR